MGVGGDVRLTALPAIPLVGAGDDLGALICRSADTAGLELCDGDVLVLAQKIVSKAEDRFVDLTLVVPSAEATAIAKTCLKDPRLVDVILSETRRVVRCAPNILIVEHRLGFIMANAGIDQSNVGGSDRVLLLPKDPDGSADRLRRSLRELAGADIAVIINDSFGRPWRQGSVGVAIGAAGLPALDDRRGQPDLFGRKLEVTMVALADEIAAAASLVMGQGNEGRPAVLVRGIRWDGAEKPAASLVRPAATDLFR